MNATVALPRMWRASGRADIPLLALASVIAIVASIAVATNSGLIIRGTAGALSVAALAVIFASVKRLELSLYALIPLLTAVRAEPAPVDFMVVGLVGALGLRGELRRSIPPRIALIGLALILVAHVPALLAAHDQSSAVKYTAATALVIAAGYVAFQLASRDPRIAGRAFVLAGVLLGVQTIIALMPIPLSSAFRMDEFRIEGLFKDPNVFGPFVIPAVTLLCAGRPALPWAVGLAAIALVMAPIPASLSRGAIVVLVVALLALAAVAAYRRWRRPLAYSLGILTLGTLAVLALLLAPGSSLAEQRLSLGAQNYDFQERLAGQISGLGYVIEHPLSLGIGPGNFDTTFPQPSHETYLRMLVETGPLSLIGLILLMWASLRMLRERDPATVAWVAALVGFATYGFFIDLLHWRHFWVVLAIPLAIRAYQEHKGVDPAREEAETS